jgi:hypothetical protein
VFLRDLQHSFLRKWYAVVELRRTWKAVRLEENVIEVVQRWGLTGRGVLLGNASVSSEAVSASIATRLTSFVNLSVVSLRTHDTGSCSNMNDCQDTTGAMVADMAAQEDSALQI